MHRLLLLATVLMVALAACGDPASSPSTAGGSTTTTADQAMTPETTAPTTTTTAGTTTSQAIELPRIKVEDGVKTEGPDTISVSVGATVRFEVEADVADEVHVHGYDITFATVADEEIVVEFVAEATGIFEVEIEGLGLHIVDVEVTP